MWHCQELQAAAHLLGRSRAAGYSRGDRKSFYPQQIILYSRATIFLQPGHPTAPADKACYGDQVLEAKEFSSAAGVVDALFTIAIACDNDDGESSEARVSVCVRGLAHLCPLLCCHTNS